MNYEDFIKLFEDKTEWISQLLERDFWDYAAIITPIVLSVVAIIISIYSLQQQNRIALFDKRYSACMSLFFLMSVIKQIAEQNVTKSEKDYFKDAVAAYQSVSVAQDVTIQSKDTSSTYTRLVLEAGKICHLYNTVDNEIIVDFLESVDYYVSNIYKGNQPDNKQLIATYNRLVEDDIQSKLEKQLKI